LKSVFLLSSAMLETGEGAMPEENTSNTQTADSGANPQDDAMPSFDEWLTGQDEKVKAIINSRFTALENTVRNTRQERDDFAKQVKEILPKAEKGSEFEKNLTETLAKLEATERRATFVEEAVKPGIDCRNPKAAYALAVTIDAFDRKGNPDWTLLKNEAPELFGKLTPPAHGGSGTDTPLQANDINSMIRRAAGR
jgi:hypothetical protein